MAQKQFKIGLSNNDKQNMAQDVYERVLALTFAEYDSAETYNEGDFVVYNDLLYKCLADNVTGTWDATKWQQATLQDLLDDVEGAVASVDGKANVDGNYPTMTVGVADQLSPYDDESGDDQDEPFSFQATGTGNGSQPDFATGSIALMKEKQGNTVVVNQLVKDGNFESSSNWTAGYNCSSVSIANNIAEFVASGSYGQISGKSLPIIEGHKYLCSVEAKASRPIIVGCGTNNTSYSYASVSTDKFTTCIDIKTANSTNLSSGVYVVAQNSQANDIIYCKNAFIIDLTQWFNADIPQDIIDNPSNFYRYYQGSLAYNTGELVNANGRYIKCIGMNQWDGINDVKAIPNATYYINGSATLTYKDREGNTISSESKSNQTFVAPSNCLSIGVSGSGNISINLYFEDEARCLTYEPYDVLTNNDTGTETLRSAGSVKDSKTPDGTITRRVGSVDLGDLDWTKQANNMFSATINGMKKFPTANGTISQIILGGYDYPKVICSKYNLVGVTYTNISKDVVGIWGCANQSMIMIFDTSYSSGNANAFKTAMSGVYLFYELDEPTTEQGTPYSENLVIDDFGSMDFQGTNGVPQGNLIFYPVDYKAFVDTLYNYTDGTPSNIALKSDLPTAPQSWAESLPGYDATKTQTLKNVEGTLTWVDDE